MKYKKKQNDLLKYKKLNYLKSIKIKLNLNNKM